MATMIDIIYNSNLGNISENFDLLNFSKNQYNDIIFKEAIEK